MSDVRKVIYHLRNGDAALWTERNPTLRDGEPGYETDTGRLKIGDGVTPWISLQYVNAGSGTSNSVELQAHIDSPTPHPAYDDGPSFVLKYENAKV